MGTGKVLPTLVIFSISAMMVFSLLPVYANDATGHPGQCKGEWEAFELIPGSPAQAVVKDKNLNGWVCSKINTNSMIMYKDDRKGKTVEV